MLGGGSEGVVLDVGFEEATLFIGGGVGMRVERVRLRGIVVVIAPFGLREVR